MKIIMLLLICGFIVTGSSQNASTLLNDVCCELIGGYYNFTSVCCPTKDDYNATDVNFNDDLLQNETNVECCSIVKSFILPQPRSLPQKFDSLRQAANGFYTFLKATQKQNKANISIIFKVNEDKEYEIMELRSKIDGLTNLYAKKLGHLKTSPPIKTSNISGRSLNSTLEASVCIVIIGILVVLLILFVIIGLIVHKRKPANIVNNETYGRSLPQLNVQNDQGVHTVEPEYAYIKYNEINTTNNISATSIMNVAPLNENSNQRIYENVLNNSPIYANVASEN